MVEVSQDAPLSANSLITIFDQKKSMPSFQNDPRRCAFGLFMILLGLRYSALPVLGQCCGGAQDIVARSHDGRYQVEAISLTGTGHQCHGPYHYRFRTLRLGAEGEAEQLGVFERAWDKDNHFSMRLCVSPTGNGFALHSALDDPIFFFSPNGTLLAKIADHRGLELHCWNERDPPLLHSVTGRTQYGRRTTKLWLPLFHLTGPETQWISDQRPSVVVEKRTGFKSIDSSEVKWLLKMLSWRPTQVVSEASQVTEFIKQSDQAGLIDLGLSALPILEAKLANNEEAVLRSTQQIILQRLCGHRDAWRNLDLLVAMHDHPHQELRNGAQEQLRVLIPDHEPTPEWLKLNREHLKWNDVSYVYHLENSE